MTGPVRGSTVPITSALTRPASARRSGHKWARNTPRGSIAVGSMEPIDATTRFPCQAHTFLCAPDRGNPGGALRRHHVEAEGERDRDLAGVEGAERDRLRQSIGRGEVNGVDGSHGLRASELRRSIEARLID